MTQRGVGNWSAVRLLVSLGCVAVFIMLGCVDRGDGSGFGGGCVQSPPSGNDNVAGNDNEPAGNDNQATGNDNVVGNENDNAVGNENENLNDNGGGTGGNDNGSTGNNDNGSTGGNDNATSNDNTSTGGNDNTSTGNDNTAGNTNTNVNSNTSGNTNVNTNTSGGGNTNTSGGTIPTKTTGAEKACAASPAVCETVTLSLEDSVPSACRQNVQWTQDASDTVQVTLTPGGVGTGSASFPVPRVDVVTTSMTLHFTVTSSGCSLGATGTATVSIQVATATWNNLPSCTELNDPLDLDAFAQVSGQPAAPDAVVLVTVEENDLVDFDFNPVTNILEVNAGVGETLTVNLQVFGTAGLLAEATDTIDVEAACP